MGDLDQLSREVAAKELTMTVQEALALLRANPRDDGSPLPWHAVKATVLDAAGDALADCESPLDAASIAAAVNAAPVLVAEVERLTALLERLRWVPVGERLSEDFEEVLGVFAYSGTGPVVRQTCMARASDGAPKWYGNAREILPPTHWQPLPAAPDPQPPQHDR